MTSIVHLLDLHIYPTRPRQHVSTELLKLPGTTKARKGCSRTMAARRSQCLFIKQDGADILFLSRTSVYLKET